MKFDENMAEKQTTQKTIDRNIVSYKQIKTPNEMKRELPLSKELSAQIQKQREEIMKIIEGNTKKKLIIVGPCSIHDTKAAIEYATRLKKLADALSDTMLIAMRVYFEKPRTKTGWRGFISDPHLDGSLDVETGYHDARALLLKIAKIGLPIATELLDTITPQYIDDLISWAAIGARTIESQPHRLMVSGLSIPTGFKNATSGHVDVAVHAIVAAQNGGNFSGIDHDGRICNIITKGNPDTHLILRGGRNGPNYSVEDITSAKQLLDAEHITTGIIIDCSHANSEKEYKKQGDVLDATIENIKSGLDCIAGVMIESHLFSGSQNIPNDLNNFDASTLTYGVSITDACLGFDETQALLRNAAKKLI